MFENQSYFQPASKLSGLLWRRDGKRKESFQQCLWNLNICIKKVDAKCLLAEMTLVMMSLPLAYFCNVCLHACSSLLRAHWWKSDSSVDGERLGNWRWNSNSRDVVASSPCFSFLLPERPNSLLAGYRTA